MDGAPPSPRCRERRASAPWELDELLPRVFALIPPLEFGRAVAASCRRFSLKWYFSLFSHIVTVPDDVPTINQAINRLARREEDPHGRFEASRGLVLVRPGIYAESVRVTQNCYVLGLGRRQSVIVEAPGWESALVFSGLGVRGFQSGEDSCIANMTFRCRNDLMRGRCVYIVLGQPALQHCDVEGGVQVSGCGTAPLLHRCNVRCSWASGVHFTDHCRGSLRESAVARSRRHGVLVDRGSVPAVAENRISGNALCGVRVYTASTHTEGLAASAKSCRGARELALRRESEAAQRVHGNTLADNGEDQCCFTPRFADTEELQLDLDDSLDLEPSLDIEPDSDD